MVVVAIHGSSVSRRVSAGSQHEQAVREKKVMVGSVGCCGSGRFAQVRQPQAQAALGVGSEREIVMDA